MRTENRGTVRELIDTGALRVRCGSLFNVDPANLWTARGHGAETPVDWD